MKNDPPEDITEILISRPEMDLLHHQQIGALAITGVEFEHDPFIDDLIGSLWDYPEDAP